MNNSPKMFLWWSTFQFGWTEMEENKAKMSSLLTATHPFGWGNLHEAGTNKFSPSIRFQSIIHVDANKRVSQFPQLQSRRETKAKNEQGKFHAFWMDNALDNHNKQTVLFFWFHCFLFAANYSLKSDPETTHLHLPLSSTTSRANKNMNKKV